MDQRDRRAPATKRNRLQPIGDADEPQQRASPPRSPPHSPESLSSSPRQESNLRHMNRGVRKLNVREGSRRRAGTRDSRSSRERDNRSSGSASPSLEDDEDMANGEPALASGRQSPATGEDAALPTASAATAVPLEHVLPTPPHEQESMEEDRASPKDVPVAAPEPDASGDAGAGTGSEESDNAEPMEHEATVPLSATDAPASGVKHDAPMVEAAAENPPVAGTSNETHKRPRSEEVEEGVGRPRSPPPPKATLASPVRASEVALHVFA